MKAQLRVARPTDHLERIVAMYRDGLGLEVLSSFRDHEGFHGTMLGRPGAEYHLEFTQQLGHSAGLAPTAENLLVFYLPDQAQWDAACARMLAAGFQAVASHNPYWERSGRTFEDIDGYRVVLENEAWPSKSHTNP